MSYEVIVSFADMEDGYFGYKAGDVYPREGMTPTNERIKALSSAKNKRGVALIKKSKEKTNPDKEV